MIPRRPIRNGWPLFFAIFSWIFTIYHNFNRLYLAIKVNFLLI